MEAVAEIPFQAIAWSVISKVMYAGASGAAYWQTLQLPALRIRIVEYTAGYLADHWCSKGHVVHCLSGSFNSELQTGECFTLTEGMSYIVSENMSTHRSFTRDGAKLLIIDGDFLKFQK